AWLESGGGGTAWDALVFDAETDTLWIGVGNGAPWNREIRSPSSSGRNNDNLFLSSVVGVDPDTGVYKCHYHETPGATCDHPATPRSTRARLEIAGRARRVLAQAPKTGFFFVTARENWGLISGGWIATQPWAQGFARPPGRQNKTAGGRFLAPTA